MSVSPDPNRPGPGCGSFPSSPLNLSIVTRRWGNECQLQKQQMPLAAEAREEGERSEQGPVRPPSDLPPREAGGGNVTSGQPPAAVSVGTGPARRTPLGPLEAGDGAWGKPWTRAQCRVSPSGPVCPGTPSPGGGFLSRGTSPSAAISLLPQACLTRRRLSMLTAAPSPSFFIGTSRNFCLWSYFLLSAAQRVELA